LVSFFFFLFFVFFFCFFVFSPPVAGCVVDKYFIKKKTPRKHPAASLNKLTAEERATLDERASLAAAAGEAKENRSELAALNAQAQARERALAEEVAVLRRSVAARRAEAEARAAEASAGAAAHAARVGEMTHGLGFYQARLGLRFESVAGDNLRLVFSRVSRADPRRECFFSVRVTEGNAYELRECEPKVEGVDAMLAEINRTNNFARLVCQMRQAFVDAVN
jgi:hypothetical protein